MHEKSWLMWIILIVGIIYLIQDLGLGLNGFAIRWYTVLFLIVGLAHCCGGPKSKRRKR